MARCPLCESDVPDGRSACDVCGQPFDRGLTTRAAPDVTKRALAAARKDLVPSGRDAADPSFARSLLERAEQTEAAGLPRLRVTTMGTGRMMIIANSF